VRGTLRPVDDGRRIHGNRIHGNHCALRSDLPGPPPLTRAAEAFDADAGPGFSQAINR
jgi:hypothetical protein